MSVRLGRAALPRRLRTARLLLADGAHRDAGVERPGRFQARAADRQYERVVDVPPARFGELVSLALDDIPAELRDAVEDDGAPQ